MDYTFSILNGTTTRQELRLSPIDDDIVEADETYNLTIVLVAANDRIHLGKNKTTTITIYNDDGKQLSM